MQIKEQYKKIKKLAKKPPFSAVIKVFTWILLFFCIYFIVSPFYPQLEYYINSKFRNNQQAEKLQNTVEELKSDDEEAVNKAKENLLKESKNPTEFDKNRLIIPSINVNINIVEGQSEEVLSLGAWRRPNSSTPDRDGNTVITGHRYQYRPPNNRTFYNLDKIEKGDDLVIIWNDKVYYYEVYEKFVVEPEDVWIEESTPEPTLTLYTCTPLWTSQKRLVVRGRLLD